MADVELTAAAAALKEHFRERVNGTHDEGMDLMVSALQERLGLPEGEARQAVSVLEKARTIEYTEGTARAGSFAQAQMPFGEALGAENPTGPATSAEVPIEGGYWRL